MIDSRFKLLPLALAAGLASCAQPVSEAPVKKAEPPPPAKHKAVGMNQRGKVTSISLTETFALQQSGNVLIFDARPGYFYNLGHIPGAISLPKPDCDAQIVKREAEIKAAIAAGKPIVVYCTNLLCADARTVASHLAGFGYSSSVLSGGWDSWKESGLPTE
ncbi:MAG: rhodanese-like domain-containing protein [Verrucomicrobiota bacterium]